jgi:Sulfate permease family
MTSSFLLCAPATTARRAAGLPHATISQWLPLKHGGRQAGIAVIVFLVDFLESISIAKAIGRKWGYDIVVSKEIVAMGVANLMGGAFSAYTTTGSFSRTAVSSDVGARSPLQGVFTGATPAPLAPLSPWSSCARWCWLFVQGCAHSVQRVRSCQRATRALVPACNACARASVQRVRSCQRATRALVPACNACARASVQRVRSCQRATRALVPACNACARACVQRVRSCLRATEPATALCRCLLSFRRAPGLRRTRGFRLRAALHRMHTVRTVRSHHAQPCVTAAGTIVGFVLLFITPVFERLSFNATAAIIVSSVIGLLNFTEAFRLFRLHFLDFIVWLAAFLGTVLAGVEIGLGIAVGLALLLVIYRSAFPHTAVLGQLPESSARRSRLARCCAPLR